MSKKFDRCVKSVRKTVKARKGSNKESAAIAICTTTLLHPRGRTLKRYRKGKLVTQTRRKIRGGGVTQADIEIFKVIAEEIKKALAQRPNEIDIPEDAEEQDKLFETWEREGYSLPLTLKLPKTISTKAANKTMETIPNFKTLMPFTENRDGQPEWAGRAIVGLLIHNYIKNNVIPNGPDKPTGFLETAKGKVGSLFSAAQKAANARIERFKDQFRPETAEQAARSAEEDKEAARIGENLGTAWTVLK